jgi:hypothetical protein
MRIRCVLMGVVGELEAPDRAGEEEDSSPPRGNSEVVFPSRLAAPKAAEPAADDEARRAERGCGPDADDDATGDEPPASPSSHSNFAASDARSDTC